MTSVLIVADKKPRAISDRRYLEQNRARVQGYRRTWTSRNPHKVKAYAKAWRDRHPLVAQILNAIGSANRRARELGVPGDLTTGFVLSLPRICALCGSTDALTLDHIVPFSRGGTNLLGNVRLLCHRCNQSKRDMLDSELIDWCERVLEHAGRSR